jgi:hypothetical protein
VFWEHSAAVLTKIAWLQSKKTYFLGDITPNGFEQLSEMRFILRGVKSLMMDRTVFEAFAQHHQTLKVGNVASFLTHLTEEEQSFYTFLLTLKEKNGLLQRDVSYAFLIHELTNFTN